MAISTANTAAMLRVLRRGLYEVVRVTLIEAFAASLPADA
jgi:hypothetical protein